MEEVKPEGVENEAVEQVAFADVLVINKTNLVNTEALIALKDRLRGINSTAKIFEAQQSRVPVDQVLNIHAVDLDKTLAMDEAFLDHLLEQFNQWLSELLRTKGADIFRSKGIISSSEAKIVTSSKVFTCFWTWVHLAI
jgi:G3E family GTPase